MGDRYSGEDLARLVEMLDPETHNSTDVAYARSELVADLTKRELVDLLQQTVIRARQEKA